MRSLAGIFLEASQSAVYLLFYAMYILINAISLSSLVQGEAELRHHRGAKGVWSWIWMTVPLGEGT